MIKHTSNENTKRDEQLVGGCEGSSDLGRSSLGLILQWTMGVRSDGVVIIPGTYHRHCGAKSTDSKATNESTNGELWP